MVFMECNDRLFYPNRDIGNIFVLIYVSKNTDDTY
jgi:hypothetical protein